MPTRRTTPGNRPPLSTPFVSTAVTASAHNAATASAYILLSDNHVDVDAATPHDFDDEGTKLPPGYGNWIEDPISDVELTYLDHIGDMAVNMLVAGPAHRVVKRSPVVSRCFH
jgi:hypothetical protein